MICYCSLVTSSCPLDLTVTIKCKGGGGGVVWVNTSDRIKNLLRWSRFVKYNVKNVSMRIWNAANTYLGGTYTLFIK